MLRPAAHMLAVAFALACLGAGAAETGVAAAGDLLPAQILLGAEPPEVVARLLESGMLVLDRPGEFVHAYVVFDRPVDRVYELLSATSRQLEYRSEIDSLATVARTPGTRCRPFSRRRSRAGRSRARSNAAGAG